MTGDVVGSRDEARFLCQVCVQTGISSSTLVDGTESAPEAFNRRRADLDEAPGEYARIRAWDVLHPRPPL